VRTGNLLNFRSTISDAAKVLWQYAYTDDGSLRDSINQISTKQVLNSRDASFQLRQMLEVAEDVCDVLASISTSASMLFINDGGDLANNDSNVELIARLIDNGLASFDNGVLSKAQIVKKYYDEVVKTNLGAKDVTGQVLFSPLDILKQKIASSGVIDLMDEVTTVHPGTRAPVAIGGQNALNVTPNGVVSGLAAGLPQLINGATAVMNHQGAIHNGAAFVAQVALNSAAGVGDIRGITQVSSFNTAATNVLIAQNGTGKTLEMEVIARVSRPFTVQSVGAGLLTTNDTLAAFTAGNFLKNAGQLVVGYKCQLHNELAQDDRYIFTFSLAPGAVISVDMPATNGNTTSGLCVIFGVRRANLERTNNESKFQDLIGLGTQASLVTLNSVFADIDYDFLDEYMSFLSDKYGSDKLADLATSFGAGSWKNLFTGEYWASLGGLTLQLKKTYARRFVRTLGVLVRQILSDCDYLKSLS
jgi:hypothetical protein